MLIHLNIHQWNLVTAAILAIASHEDDENMAGILFRIRQHIRDFLPSQGDVYGRTSDGSRPWDNTRISLQPTEVAVVVGALSTIGHLDPASRERVGIYTHEVNVIRDVSKRLIQQLTPAIRS